jgi:hypothetical protein
MYHLLKELLFRRKRIFDLLLLVVTLVLLEVNDLPVRHNRSCSC